MAIAGTSSTMRAISVSLAVQLAQLLKTRAQTSGQPQAQIVLDAVLQARHELSGLVADRRRAAQWTDELFVGTAAAVSEPRTTVSLRMLPATSKRWTTSSSRPAPPLGPK